MTGLQFEKSIIQAGVYFKHLRATIAAAKETDFIHHKGEFLRLRDAIISNTVEAIRGELLAVVADTAVGAVETLDGLKTALKELATAKRVSDVKQSANQLLRLSNPQSVGDCVSEISLAWFGGGGGGDVENTEAVEAAQKILAGETTMFIKSHIAAFDDDYGGFPLGKVTACAGYSMNGKTVVARNMIMRNADNPDVYLRLNTTEVKPSELMLNIACDETGVSYKDVITQKATAEQLLKVDAALKKWGQMLGGRAIHSTLDELTDEMAMARLWAQRIKAQNPNAKFLLVLDFINKFTYNGKPVWDNEVMRNAQTVLSNFAEQTGIGVVQFCQMRVEYQQIKPDKEGNVRLPNAGDIYFSQSIIDNAFTSFLTIIPERLEPLKTGRYEGKPYQPLVYAVLKSKVGGYMKTYYTALKNDGASPCGQYGTAINEVADRLNMAFTALPPNSGAIAKLHEHFGVDEVPF